MKKKVNWGIIALLFFTIVMIGFVASFIMGLFGNPITKLIASSKIEKYVQNTYPDLDLEISSVVYNFKFGDYQSHVQSRTSPDTAFTVSWNDGTLNDSYDQDVTKHYQTYIRLQMELSKLVEATISKDFPYETSIVFADLDKSRDDYSMLTLDMPFDGAAMPVPTSLTIYFYEDKIDYEVFQTHILELKDIMKMNNIRIDFYSVVMEKTPEKGEKPTLNRESIYLYDYPASKLDSDNLIEEMKEYMANWESENKK